MPTKLVKIYPVPGVFHVGVPAVEQEVPSGEAKELIASGAFSEKPVREPPPPSEPEEE